MRTANNAPCGHARRAGDPGDAVFDNQCPPWSGAHPLCAMEEKVWGRFAAAHPSMRRRRQFRKGGKTGYLQRKREARRSAPGSDAFGNGQSPQDIGGARYWLQVPPKGGEQVKVPGIGEFLRKRPAGAA